MFFVAAICGLSFRDHPILSLDLPFVGLVGGLAVIGLILILAGWIDFVRARSEVHMIDRLLNDA